MLIPHSKWIALSPLLSGSALSGTFIWKKANSEPVDETNFKLSVVTLVFFLVYLFYFLKKKSIL